MRAAYCSLPHSVWNRVLAVFRAGFEAQWRGGAWPVAPLIVHGSIAAVFALLVRDVLPPYAYAIVMLSLAMALLALPLLGDFGFLLRADPAREWVEALPVRAAELRIARTMLLLLLVMALASAALLPIALFAPSGTGVIGRVALFAAGAGQALFVAGMLLGLQSLLGQRAEALLVLFQTLLVGGIVVGCLIGLRLVPMLVHAHAPDVAPSWIAVLPPAWFATVLVDDAHLSAAWRAAPWIALAFATAVLFVAPQATASVGRRPGWLAALLAPVRALLARTWVTRRERGSFDLVYDALPLEREFVLRAYPMIAIPLAMLFAGSRGASGIERDGLIAVLLFTPATYLPILLVHVPATASPDARWIIDGAPVQREEVDNGALKALAVRFLLPLYALLFAMAWSQAGPELALRLAPIGFLLSLLVMRRLYPVCVTDVPLSRPAGEIEARMDWTGILLGLGLVLTIVAIAALKLVTDAGRAVFVCAVLLFVEWLADRSVRTAAGRAQDRSTT
jgi:hypothetical protein